MIMIALRIEFDTFTKEKRIVTIQLLLFHDMKEFHLAFADYRIVLDYSPSHLIPQQEHIKLSSISLCVYTFVQRTSKRTNELILSLAHDRLKNNKTNTMMIIQHVSFIVHFHFYAFFRETKLSLIKLRSTLNLY
jgi:hypothetical protein